MRILFNGWFSTAYHFIELIRKGAKEDNLEVTMIGTHQNPAMVYKQVCDEFYTEPKNVSDVEYVDWLISFCKEQHIDVVFAKRHLIATSSRIDEFRLAGIKVVVDPDVQLLAVLENKIGATIYLEMCKAIGDMPICAIAATVEEFKSSYEWLKECCPNDTFCLKYVNGEGGSSYRRIVETPITIEHLNATHKQELQYNQVIEMLASVEDFEPIMIMPYLEGPEISIDCLNTKAGLIAIPRIKGAGRIKEIRMDKELIAKAQAFADFTNLQHPFNLQYRYSNGKLYFLEVNTRMSGGAHISCLAGVNIPYLALRNVLDLPITLPNELKSVNATHIELPVLLED